MVFTLILHFRGMIKTPLGNFFISGRHPIISLPTPQNFRGRTLIQKDNATWRNFEISSMGDRTGSLVIDDIQEMTECGCGSESLLNNPTVAGAQLGC